MSAHNRAFGLRINVWERNIEIAISLVEWIEQKFKRNIEVKMPDGNVVKIEDGDSFEKIWPIIPHTKNLLSMLNKDSYQKPLIVELKKNLPCLSLGANYMVMDYDNLTDQECRNVLSIAKRIPYVLAGQRSASGKGVYLVIQTTNLYKNKEQEFAYYYHHAKRALEFVIPHEIDCLPDHNRLRFLGSVTQEQFVSEIHTSYKEKMAFLPTAKEVFITNDENENPVPARIDKTTGTVRKFRVSKHRAGSDEVTATEQLIENTRVTRV